MTDSRSTATDHACPECGAQMDPDEAAWYVSVCPSCGYEVVFKSDIDELNAIRKARAEAENAARVGGILAASGIPELFRSVEPDSELARRIAIGGKGLYLQGGNGTFKSLKAASVAKAFVLAGRSVRFVQCSMLSDLYADSERRAEYVRGLVTVDLLVLDDLGKQHPSDWTSSLLFSVVDGRYGAMLPVVVTSNYTKAELVERLSTDRDTSTAEAIVSRLFEMTEKVEMGDEDRRLA